jgi:hypothetical protein
MFQGWDSFYLLIGSAAAALVGLLFVVATLTTNVEQASASAGANLYMTPVVFHFAMVLVLSALALAPGVTAGAAGPTVGAAALVGLVYMATVAIGQHRRRREASEPPHWSDFWWYGAAPLAIYLALGCAAAALWADAHGAALALGLVLMVSLLVGVRNAWDLVTWLAPRKKGA